MNIVHAASELFPFMKTGGLADVTAALSKELARFGHNVSFFLPGYRRVLENPEFKKAKLKVVIQVEMGDVFLRGEVYALSLGKRRKLYVIRRDEFFDRSEPYGTSMRDYDDNDRRFIFFSKAIVEAMHVLSMKADILHCHDWQTALAPLFLRMEEQQTETSLALKTFLTIHNLAFQGLFPSRSFELTNLPVEFNSPDGIEFYEQINFMKGGISFSDTILTVSSNYAREILTAEYGCGLEGVLVARKEDLFGIANGVDTEFWDPQSDTYLPHNFSKDDLAGKMKCRDALLKEFGLPKPDDKPVYGIVCRLTQQKGLELLLKQMNFFVSNDCRLVVLGKGDLAYERAMKRWAKAHPEHVAFRPEVDEPLSHLIEAGSDFFLMPSIFEPCGLNQMYSQRYGAVPLVSDVGGLKDTVISLEESPATGTGVVCQPEAKSFKQALQRSLDLFADKDAYAAAQKRGMEADFSWERSVKAYEGLYSVSI